ncbi:hypothetical protein ACTWQF_09930 [Streptomyces sp. 8N114]|uniref:hypothetical protein n=1 Tax=Streptomyces sp. 8N114 TaxID=3457419 RepID=UPI003FD03970
MPSDTFWACSSAHSREHATWHLLHRLRRRSRGEEVTHYQLAFARQHLRAAGYLLDWLEEWNLTLATCRQTDLERWMTSDDVRPRRETGHFVRWALSQKMTCDLSFPAERWNDPTQWMHDEPRWDTTRRLLHTPQAPRPPRRLRLHLYAQWPATISRLTIDHIEETGITVRIHLGAVPVELPAPVAELALHQVKVRRSHATLARTDHPGSSPVASYAARSVPGPWANASANSASASLKPPQTALFQLATDLPAAVLARTLGTDITVAVEWQRAAAGDWAAYAAEVSRRNLMQEDTR